jgi:DNA-binding NarL/FixJ family response regulator
MIRIALIDDDALVGAGLARVLVEPDVMVTSVSTALEGGIDRIVTERPDVVVCDVMLDGTPKGLDLPARLRATRAAGTPVILLSSFGADHLVGLARDRGAAGYLTKDVDPGVLVSAIRVAAAGGHTFRGPTPGGDRSPSPREIEVIRAVANGWSTDETGRRLSISSRTVDAHLRRMFERYDVASRTQLVILAVQRGWITELPR